MAATTVAGLTACSNVEDEPLPGLGGGGTGDVTTPSVVITDTIYSFDNIEADYTPINELCPGWTHEIVSPVDDDRTWQSKTFDDEKYIQATAHDGSGSNAGKTYDLWMISPALDVKNAPNKVFSFYSEGSYWQSTSSLEVYVLNEPTSNASSQELLSDVRIATSADGNYKWIASGDISLEGKGDTVYVAFRYKAQGGKSNSTTYCIDDFAFGRAQVGLGGGALPEPQPDPSTVMLLDTIYTFDNITAQYTPINELCAGWVHEIVSPTDDDRTWQSKTFNNSTAGVTEKYIQATAHDGTDANAGKTYDLWMITPALNVKDAANKVFSFYSEGAYWQETSSLEVYVLNEPTSNASSKEKLNPVLATSTNPGGNFKGWVASGDISLEGKGDVVYIGFRYVAQGGKSNSTTYCIDDFAFGRTQVEHYMGEGGGDTPEPTPDPTPDVDWSNAVSVADALQIANDESVTVKGYVVGCIKNKPSKTSYKTFDEAKQAGDIEWAGDAEFTGYTQVFIADNAGETDGSKCILLDINDTADAKALKELAKLEGHPERIGMAVSVKGVRKNRYGLPGVREISAYKVGE